MSLLELNYTKINLTSQRYFFNKISGGNLNSRLNTFIDYTDFARHVQQLDENKVDILGFLAKILDYKYKNLASFN